MLNEDEEARAAYKVLAIPDLFVLAREIVVARGLECLWSHWNPAIVCCWGGVVDMRSQNDARRLCKLCTVCADDACIIDDGRAAAIFAGRGHSEASVPRLDGCHEEMEEKGDE